MRAVRLPIVRLPLVILALLLVPQAGCGSKISEANYYRVHYGMDEEDVEDLLGPAASETVEDGPTSAAATMPAGTRKVKKWTRGDLTLSVVFEGGKVVGRSAEGARG